MAIITLDTALSANDKRILDALFDPETLPSSIAESKTEVVVDPSLPSHPNISSSMIAQLEDEQNQIIRQVSSGADNAAVEDALYKMNEIVKQWPTYPSTFVNRAMLRRMQLESRYSEQTIFRASEEAIEDLFLDLSSAIDTALSTSSPTGPVSIYQARILRTAYSHRAYLYLKAAESGISLKANGQSELEELASGDFSAAARYGDKVAREMSVRTNPYAKMCGAIVKNALREERLVEMA
jgi:hypothetical protein